MPLYKPNTPDAFGIDPAVFKKPGSLLLQEDVEFLDTPELAQTLEVEEKVVRRMIDRHAVNVYRVAGKLLFRRTDILAYLNHKEDPKEHEFIPSHAGVSKGYSRDWWQQHDNFDELAKLIGYTREKSPKNSVLRWMVVEGTTGMTFLVQREHRDGIGFILNPSEENLTRYRESPWMAWNEAKILRI